MDHIHAALNAPADPIQTLHGRIAELKASIAALVSTQGYVRAKPPKPDVFKGRKGVVTWFYTVEKYFDALHLYGDDARLEYVVTLLHGPAANWWHMLEEHSTRGGHPLPTTWTDFKDAITTQFQPLAEERAARLKLERMSQTGTVHDYVDAFSNMVLLIPSMDEGTRLQFFEHGLKLGVKKWVRQQRPSTLLEAMSYAEEYDASDFQDRALDRALHRRFQTFPKIPSHCDGPTPMELNHATTNERKPRANMSHQPDPSHKGITCWKRAWTS